MTAREVVFDGSPPWGFRMNGGTDSGHPLRISRVNPGSKAESQGVREGDMITSINGQPTTSLTNSDSHALLRTVKENLRLGLNENQNGSPRRRSKEIKALAATSEKDIALTPTEKENTKPSRSKLRRQRKRRLKSLLKEKLLGFKETPGHVLTTQPVPEGPQFPTSAIGVKGGAENDDNTSAKFYDNAAIDGSSISNYSVSTTRDAPLVEGSSFVQNASALVSQDSVGDSRSAISDNASGVGKFENTSEPENAPKEVHSGLKSYENVTFAPQEVQHAEIHVWPRKPRMGVENTDYNLIEAVKTVEDEVNAPTSAEPLKSRFCERSETSIEGDFKVPMAETIEFLDSTNLMDALPPTTDAEESVYELIAKDMRTATVSHHEEDGFPYDLNEPVLRIRSPTEIPSCFLPPRRYLDVISEETSDLSDGDRPWENSEKIREINACIDTIPDDWYGPQDGIDTSWRDGKSLEEMSDIPTISDSHSDSELTVDDPKNSFTASHKTDVNAQVKPTRISGANRTEQKGGTSSSENVVVNVVSSFYTSKPVLKPTKIETLFNIDKLHGPNSDVVEIVYLDSSDSEAISSAKSETNLATTPIQEDASDLDRDLRSLKKLPTDMTDDEFKISSPAEEGADDKPSSPSSYQNVDVGHRTPSKLSESIQHSESTHSNSLPNSSNHVSEKPSKQEFAGDEEEKQISALISDITESANDLISSSNEHLSVPSCCGSPQNGSGGRKKISAAEINHRCCSAPLVEGESPPVFKTSRSVCSADMGDEYPNFICDNSDTSSQSTAKRLQSRVVSLRELSMTAVLRLPFGISFLKQLGFDQSEYDSYSGYMPEGSEYSFSSKQPMSEGESFVLNDGSDYEDESISNSLPSRPLHYGSHLPPSPPSLGDVKHYEQNQKPLDVRENSKPMKPNEVDLLDLHQKFVLRRGYHEPGEKFLRNKFDRTSNDKEDQDEDFSLEFLALREYHALRQRKMKDAKLAAHNLPRGEEEPKGNSTSATDIGTIECDLNRPSLGSAGDKVAQEEVVDNSRLLELIQSDDFKGSDAELNMSARTSPNRIMLDRSPNSSVGSGSLDIFRNLPAWDKEPTESGMVDSLGLDGENNKANYSKNDAIKVFGSQNDVSRPRQESRDRPKSVPPSGERFRQLMYDEYMNKLAELSQRRKMRAIKLTEPVKSISKPPPNCEDDLRGEFMTRVRERMFKLGLTDDFVLVDNSILADRQIDHRQSEEKKLPKHMQELIDIVDEIGVWSPVNTSDADKKGLSSPSTEEPEGPKREENSEPTPAIWTPRSAGPSPTLGRKFRPVNFQSPTPPRKTSPAQKPKEEPELPKELPAQTTTSSFSSSEIPCRLTSSTSENSTLTSTQLRLPSSQNPTITLLQKAREGQIPKGAQYLDGHHPNDQNSTVIAPGEIVYSVKKQYSKADDEGVKKIVELTPKKFSGIGPTTQDGVPIGLRSEVNENNHQRWYKRMYDSLHKTADHDKDFVTVRYKTRRKDQHPHSSYSGGYASEPERLGYESDASLSKYATLDRRKIRNKENDFTASTLPRNKYAPSAKHAVNVYKNQPGRIEDYEPGNSSIADIEKKQWWDEVLDIFDGELNNSSKDPYATPSRQSFTTYALRDTGYDSDSTLVFKRRENMSDNLSPAEQKMAYKVIQRGGEVPLHGLRKAIPDRPKDSPHRYVESEVNIHYKSPIRSEAKVAWPEDELAEKQAEIMRRIYQEQRRTKYLNELHDMYSRRHTDNLLPSQKSPIPLNRYDDFPLEQHPPRPRDRTPEPKLVARAMYNFVGQTPRELSFRRGDIIYVRRQIDKHWYEGEHNAMIGLFPFNYVEIIPHDGIRTLPRKANEGQARAKFNFQAQTHLELSLVKGELVLLTRRVDENWFEGRIGNRKGIFPVSYVEVLVEPGERILSPSEPISTKPIVAPASHCVMLNGAKDIGQQHYQPPRPALYSCSSLPPHSKMGDIGMVSQSLHIDTQSDPVPYRVLYNYKPQNDDELELKEGDVVYVMEKCDDGWYVGSLHRNGQFGTFPGNYVDRII